MARTVLVAGIGNVFLGDDGFGVEVARRLAQRPQPNGVQVRDFGIRGFDLAFALLDDWDCVVLIDAVSRGGRPGELWLLEALQDWRPHASPDAHAMDPERVLAFARTLGPVPDRVFVLGCEPQVVLDGATTTDVLVELSAPVASAAEGAIEMIEALLRRLVIETTSEQTPGETLART